MQIYDLFFFNWVWGSVKKGHAWKFGFPGTWLEKKSQVFSSFHLSFIHFFELMEGAGLSRFKMFCTMVVVFYLPIQSAVIFFHFENDPSVFLKSWSAPLSYSTGFPAFIFNFYLKLFMLISHIRCSFSEKKLVTTAVFSSTPFNIWCSISHSVISLHFFHLRGCDCFKMPFFLISLLFEMLIWTPDCFLCIKLIVTVFFMRKTLWHSSTFTVSHLGLSKFV